MNITAWLTVVSFAEGSLMFWFVTLVLLWLTRDVGGVGGWGDAFPSGFVFHDFLKRGL